MQLTKVKIRPEIPVLIRDKVMIVCFRIRKIVNSWTNKDFTNVMTKRRRKMKTHRRHPKAESTGHSLWMHQRDGKSFIKCGQGIFLRKFWNRTRATYQRRNRHAGIVEIVLCSAASQAWNTQTLSKARKAARIPWTRGSRWEGWPFRTTTTGIWCDQL